MRAIIFADGDEVIVTPLVGGGVAIRTIRGTRTTEVQVTDPEQIDMLIEAIQRYRVDE